MAGYGRLRKAAPEVRLPFRRCLGFIVLVCQALALLLAGPALAAPTHIAATLIAEGPATPGGTVTLAIRMQPEPGWHGYWLNPGDAGLGMELGWTLPAGCAGGRAALSGARHSADLAG